MSYFELTFFQSLYFLFTPGFANLSAILAAKFFPRWSLPLDCRLTFRGRRILGDHKTWRGLVAGIVVGQACFFLQLYLASHSSFFSRVGLFNVDAPWFLGSILGFYALLGDAIKSFFKRRVNIAPGQSWMPWDQIDWILASIILAKPFFSSVTYWHVVLILSFGFLLDIAFKKVGYFLQL